MIAQVFLTRITVVSMIGQVDEFKSIKLTQKSPFNFSKNLKNVIQVYVSISVFCPRLRSLSASSKFLAGKFFNMASSKVVHFERF